jgi:hypothetical protein
VSQLCIKALQLVEGQLALTAIGDQSLAIVIILNRRQHAGGRTEIHQYPWGQACQVRNPNVAPPPNSLTMTGLSHVDFHWMLSADSGLPSYQPTSHKHLILSSPEVNTCS